MRHIKLFEDFTDPGMGIPIINVTRERLSELEEEGLPVRTGVVGIEANKMAEKKGAGKPLDVIDKIYRCGNRFAFELKEMEILETLSPGDPHLIEDNKDRLNFMLAGNARFTVKNTQSGNRFTYRVRKLQGSEDGPFFVSVLTSPDMYTFIGTVFDGKRFKHSPKSRVGQDAQSVRTFDYVFRHVLAGNLPASIQFWHEGKCGKCGRTLTVPESIANGIGPECAKRMRDRK